MTTKYLVIGGSKDGEYIEDNKRNQIVLRSTPMLSSWMVMMPDRINSMPGKIDSATAMMAVTQEVYNINKLGPLKVWILDGMSMEEVLLRLTFYYVPRIKHSEDEEKRLMMKEIMSR